MSSIVDLKKKIGGSWRKSLVTANVKAGYSWYIGTAESSCSRCQIPGELV